MTLITAVILLIFMFLLNEITRIVGVILIIAYIVYLYILIRSQKTESKEKIANVEDKNLVEESQKWQISE